MQNLGYHWVVVGLVANAGCASAPQEQPQPEMHEEDVVLSEHVEAGAPSSDVSTAISAEPTAHVHTEGALDVVAADPPSPPPVDAGEDVESTSRVQEGTSSLAPSNDYSLSFDTLSDAGATSEVEEESAPDSGTTLDSLGDAGVDVTVPVDAGPAQLTALIIDGARTQLYPAFEPGRTHYSIVAQAGVTALGVTATVNGDAHVSVNGVELASEQRAELTGVAPGSKLVFTLAQEPDATQYVVEYLPVGFPELFVEKPALGVSDEPLYLNLDSTGGQFLVKLDADGIPNYYKQEPRQVYDFKKHADGTLSYTTRRESRAAGAHYVLMDSQFQETARLSAVGLVNTDAHDFLILPNGNRVFTSYEPGVHDLSALGRDPNEQLVDSVFQEVTPDGQVLFQWNSWGHVSYENSVYAFKRQDYAHGNSVFLDHDESWLYSARALSQVYKIDRVTGDVIWSLGGIEGDFVFVSDPYNGFCGQHNATRLDNGHILLFDNGCECLPEVAGSRHAHSRAVEYAVDEVAMTAELVWSYEREEILAQTQGSAQRLSNGNTIIGWGSNSSGVLATEVNPAGEVVYELTGRTRDNSRLASYRARRFAD